MKNSLRQLLNDTTDYRPAVVARLKESNLPIVIYGAGQIARSISSVLESHGMTNYIYAVDEQYLGEGTDVSIVSPAQADDRFDRYALVYGHSRGYMSAIPPQFKNAVSCCVMTGHTEMEVIGSDFLSRHLDEFEETYSLLEDELSRESMSAYLGGKLNHNGEAMLPFVIHEEYFIDNLFRFEARRSYIDCGAFNGDTILKFASKYGDYGHIVGFEPDKRNFEALTRNVAELTNVTAVNRGCSDAYATVAFAENSNDPMRCAISAAGNTTIEVDKIDSYTANIPPVGLIKMDIEGAELSALKGAATTVAKDKPVLAVCVYHKAGDLITIPQYIQSLAPEYKIYLRYSEDTPITLNSLVLYAVCDKDAPRR
jgi:FkbM family methyltransferase